MSEILKSIHEDMQALQQSGAVDEVTIRNFDAMCLTPVTESTADYVKREDESSHACESLAVDLVRQRK